MADRSFHVVQRQVFVRWFFFWWSSWSELSDLWLTTLGGSHLPAAGSVVLPGLHGVQSASFSSTCGSGQNLVPSSSSCVGLAPGCLPLWWLLVLGSRLIFWGYRATFSSKNTACCNASVVQLVPLLTSTPYLLSEFSDSILIFWKARLYCLFEIWCNPQSRALPRYGQPVNH